ncbi:choice-of-anchor D domain-containing protein, partial [Nostoc sp. NIES-2111]
MKPSITRRTRAFSNCMTSRPFPAMPHITASALLALTLAACGGGGGSTPAPQSPPPVNRSPLAHAGAEQTVRVGAPLQLDGRGSTDPDGDPLSYAWTLSARPEGSTAVLADSTSATPRFLPDQAGVYVAALVVHDGRIASAAAQVRLSVTAERVPPVADAGPAQEVVTGARVTLSGAASRDGDGDALTYRWTLVEKPAASNAQLTGGDSVSPTFVADAAGRYVARLVVNDGVSDSAGSDVRVQAATARLAADVMPLAADFGTVPVGGSAARVIKIRNTGNGVLSFRPGLPGTDGGAWSMGARSCVGTLAPASECTVTVNFTPTNAQAYAGALEVGFAELPTGQGGPRVPLTGVGSGNTTRVASVTPAVADFGDVPLGMAAARVFRVSNGGTERLTFKPGYPAIDGAPWSLGGSTCTGVLEPGSSCTVMVNFMPVSAQAFTGNVRFYFNELQDGQGNPMASLVGKGQGDVQLAASMTPAVADFGLVPVGTTAERVLTLVNMGNGPLHLRPGSPGVSGSPWSLRGGSCLVELPVGARCTVTLGFTPTNTQAFTGSAFVHFVELPV